MISAFEGPRGALPLVEGDEIAVKLAMLCEGVCVSGAPQAAQKFGYSRQRYYQLLREYKEKGALGLKSETRGPKTNYRRPREVVLQVVRHCFLDPKASAKVIAQKLRQSGWPVSTRSVERIIEEFGIQKKTPRVSS